MKTSATPRRLVTYHRRLIRSSPSSASPLDDLTGLRLRNWVSFAAPLGCRCACCMPVLPHSSSHRRHLHSMEISHPFPHRVNTFPSSWTKLNSAPNGPHRAILAFSEDRAAALAQFPEIMMAMCTPQTVGKARYCRSWDPGPSWSAVPLHRGSAPPQRSTVTRS
jgi:hypothetical protein